jgi:L-amino acid N-acyltransferase YncA
MPFPRIRKAGLVLARHGVRGLLRTLRTAARPHTYLVYRRDLALESADAAIDVIVRRGSLDVLRQWREDREAAASPFLSDRTSGWTRFWWGWLNEEPVGIVWSTGTSPLLRTGAGEVVIVDLYTNPAFRGRRIAPTLLLAACRDLRKEGFCAAYATIDVENVPSQRAFERSGFTRVGGFTCWSVFRRRRRTSEWAQVDRNGAPRVVRG